jgi:HPt (histidine-containing phosphotransfer) domain-containing protein
MVGRAGEAKPMAAKTADPIDLEHLNQVTFGNRALAREVLSLFDRQAEKLLAEIVAAPHDRSRREAAHALRGGALGIGAVAVAEAAGELETAGQDAADVTGATGRLAAHIAAARLAIARFLTAD